MSEGEPLIGGSDSQGIVRIGDTVGRPLRPFSLTVQAYLVHLRGVGFTGAPLPLGVDGQGREMLSFVPVRYTVTRFRRTRRATTSWLP